MSAAVTWDSCHQYRLRMHHTPTRKEITTQHTTPPLNQCHPSTWTHDSPMYLSCWVTTLLELCRHIYSHSETRFFSERLLQPHERKKERKKEISEFWGTKVTAQIIKAKFWHLKFDRWSQIINKEFDTIILRQDPLTSSFQSFQHHVLVFINRWSLLTINSLTILLDSWVTFHPKFGCMS